MMRAHSWNLSPKEAIGLQKELRHEVRLAPLARPPRTIAGCDVSLNRFAKEGFGGFVVLAYPALTQLAESVVHDAIPFPYIPGLLSFREIPLYVKAWEKLAVKPEVLLVDG